MAAAVLPSAGQALEPAQTALVSRQDGAIGSPFGYEPFSLLTRPAVAGNGRYVAFVAPSAVGPDAVYVRDTEAGTTELVSRASDSAGGAAADQSSYLPAISADGRYVAFASYASNLDADKSTTTLQSVFVRDRQAGTTTLVARESDTGGTPGAPLATSTSDPSLSADGRTIAFVQTATSQFDPGYVLKRDLATGVNTVVSRADGSAGAVGNRPADYTAITPDGRYVAFGSRSDNLGVTNPNRNRLIYLRDTVGDTTKLVSRADGATGAPANTDAGWPSLSADGRYAAFASVASNLSPDKTTTDESDVFIRDVAGDTLRHLPASVGSFGTTVSSVPSLAADGSLVAYTAENPAAANPDHRDVVVADLTVADPTPTIVSRASGDAGDVGNDDSTNPVLSADRKAVAFVSESTNLADASPGTFLRDLRPGGAPSLDPPLNTAAPQLDGDARVGQTLTATTGTWLNSPTSYAFAWSRCDTGGGTCTATGVTTASYPLTGADAGATLRATVTATNASGARTSSSPPSSIVLAPAVNTARPSVSGEPVHGATLTAQPGTWDVTPTGYAYAWERCDGDTCTPIDGASSSAYVLSAADVGHAVRVLVTAQVAAGSGQARSASTSVVRPSIMLTGTPAGLDFGTVPARERSAAQSITVTNTGLDATRVTNYVSGASFPYGASTCAQRVLGAGESCTVAIEFRAPATVGPADDTFVLSAQGVADVRVPLHATVSAQRQITGRVLDDDAGGAPIAGAIVSSNAVTRSVTTDADGVYHLYYADLLPGGGTPYIEAWAGTRTTTAVVAIDPTSPATVQDLHVSALKPPPAGAKIFGGLGTTADGIPKVPSSTPWAAKVPLQIDGSGPPNTADLQSMFVGLRAAGGGLDSIAMIFFEVYFDANGAREGISDVVVAQLDCRGAAATARCARFYGELPRAPGSSVRAGRARLRQCAPPLPTSANPKSNSIEILPPLNKDQTFQVLIRGPDGVPLLEAVPIDILYIGTPRDPGDPFERIPMLLGALQTGANLGSNPEQRYAYAVALARGDLGEEPRAIATENYFQLTVETPGLDEAVHGAAHFWWQQQVLRHRGRKVKGKTCEDDKGGGGGGGGGAGGGAGGDPDPGGGSLPPGPGGGGALYIDPSGRVETTKKVPLRGATVTLARADSATGPLTPVPNGSTLMSPSNRVNPGRTGALGLFAWDVQPGYYRVDAKHRRCRSSSTPVLAVPPPRLDLVIRLKCKGITVTASRLRLDARPAAKGFASVRARLAARRGRASRSALTGVITFRAGKKVVGRVAVTPTAAAVVIVPTTRRRQTITATFEGNGVLGPSTARTQVAGR